ncbi:MAG: polyamine aminopropyltransferase [Candidatus Omnitrophota bacterium]
MSEVLTGSRLKNSQDESWFQETLHDGFRQSHQITSVLASKKTKFQDCQLLNTPVFGRMLVLDGVVQTTEKDEFVYHEMLTHIAMLTHPDPKRVLIIGAGDGGILREVLKYDVEQVTMVEIDADVIEFSKEHLPMICENAFEDKRAKVLVDDGAKFVEQTKEKFDVVLVDSPDPIGPAKVLFSEKFYNNVFNCLTADGVMARQSGVPVLQGPELSDAVAVLKKVFPKVFVYLASIPTYIGGFFSFVFGSKTYDPTKLSLDALKKKYEAVGLKSKYYNPEIHLAAFALPNFVKDLASKGGK